MNLFSSDSKKRARTIFAIAGLLLPVAAAICLYLCAGRVHSAATYFHAALVEQGPGTFFSGDFPALQLSAWKEAFTDQSLLFHLFLWLTGWMGGDTLYTGWITLLLLIFMGSTLFAAKKINLRMRTFFAGSLLFLFVSVLTFNDMTNLSPDPVALAALMLTIGILAMETTEKKRCILIAICAFVSAWSIPCPQIILLPVLLTGTLKIRKGSFSAMLPFTAGTGAMLAGLLIHPQTPASLTAWKLHNWDRIIHALAVNYDANLTAGELLSPSGKEAFFALPVLLLCFLAWMLWIRLYEFRGRGAVRGEITAMLITACFFALSFFWIKSAILFAAPPAVLAFLSLADTTFRGEASRWKDCWKKAAWGFFAVSLLLTILTSWLFVKEQKEVVLPVQIGEYLKENLPENEPVLNGDWRYFPQLYKVAPQIRWQWGIDPVHSLEKEKARIDFLTTAVPAGQLAGVIGIRHIVILEPYRNHVRALERCGWQVIRTFPGEGWILTVK